MVPAILGLTAAIVYAEPAVHDPEADLVTPDGIHILDGSFYLNVGELQVNITNHGLIGSQYSSFLPYSSSPSAQWPAGSGHEYLWGAGLWVGGRVQGEISVSTGQYEREFRPGPRLEDTIYEGKGDFEIRPHPRDQETGRRQPSSWADDDNDGTIDEDILNGRDDDGDGEIDEDWGQIGDQMFTCTMFDNLPLCRELYPAHRPLGLKIVQRAAAWANEQYEDFIALDYEITNVGRETIKDAYLGFFVDCDIQSRGLGGNQPDDLAGSWEGLVRGEDNFFYKVDIAYMRDNAREDPLPGWFGVNMIYHTREFYAQHAPATSEVTGFQIFATNASVSQQGEPLSDHDRYNIMARKGKDRTMRDDQSGDMKFLISSGPFPLFDPGSTLVYRLALVVGDGLDDMLANAAMASRLGAGTFFDDDGDYYTGRKARETKICLGDIPNEGSPDDPIFRYKIDAADQTCIGPEPVFGVELVKPNDLRDYGDGKWCVYVNGDNCDECERYFGQECTIENGLFWSFYAPFLWYYEPSRFTGVQSREKRYAWTLERDHPPSSPNMRVQAGNHWVEVFWDDLSELEEDPITGEIDFESYRVWRVQDWIRPDGLDEESRPPTAKWALLAEYDLINEIARGVGGINHARPLGGNTGLEDARYTPACLADPEFDGLAEEMRIVVDSDPRATWLSRPEIRLADGSVAPGMEGLVPWEMRPDVLDTFYAVTRRLWSPGVLPKRATKYYHFLDPSPPNGFPLYYSVVATDHLLFWDRDEYVVAGPGVGGRPGENYRKTMPRPDGQTVIERQAEGVNIYAYPNPATRESLAEFQQQFPTFDDATGQRIMFTNLPDSRNTIKIFTAAGDLIVTLDHDADTMGGSISWNLVSRNGQQIVSGIYLYVVESADSRFDDFQGRFVVIR